MFLKLQRVFFFKQKSFLAIIRIFGALCTSLYVPHDKFGVTLPRYNPKQQGLFENWLFKVKILSRYILGTYVWFLLNVHSRVLGLLHCTDTNSKDHVLIHPPQAGVK